MELAILNLMLSNIVTTSYNNHLHLFDDIQKERLLQTKQLAFRITKLNTFQYGDFAWITNSQLILNAPLREKSCLLGLL